MNGLLRCNINTGVRSRTRGVDVLLRDVTIAQMGNGVTECGWRHAPEAKDFGRFWKSQLGELRTGHRTRRVDFRLFAEALGRCRTRWGGIWKSQNRKNVYLSPYVEEPLNSKVIKKSFVPELRSRKCFRVSRFLCSVYIYIYIYMNIICPFHTYSWMGMLQY